MPIKKLGRPVVVEGPDGSGKSTLCRDLSYTLEVEVFHTGGPIKSEKEYRERAADLRARGGIIFDRHPDISGRVYSIFQPEDGFVPTTWHALTPMRPVVIFCTHVPQVGNSLDEFLATQKGKAHKDREYATKVWESAQEIQSRYADIVPTVEPLPGVDVVFYDYEVHRLPETVVELAKLGV